MFSGVLSGTISSYTAFNNHNLYCGKIVEEGTLFVELDMVAQAAVLSCPHRSHQGVHMIFRTFCDTKVTDKIEEGKLF